MSLALSHISAQRRAVRLQRLLRNVQGYMWDFYTIGGLYQDGARATLVSALSEPIGGVLDLSGHGFHLTGTGTARPTFQFGARFDGADDYLVSPSIDFTGTDAITVVSSVRKNSSAAAAILYEFSTSINSNNGTFSVVCPTATGAGNIRTLCKGTVQNTAIINTGLDAPINFIHSMQQDISAPLARQRINRGAWNTTASSQGTGNLGNYPLYVGIRGGGLVSPVTVDYVRKFGIGRQLTDAELALAEDWVNEPIGVALP